MKLYYSPGACSLAVHIALRELGIPFEAVAVDLTSKVTSGGKDFNAVNPKGYVPALELADERILTEVPAVLHFLADLKPAQRLAPVSESLERYRLEEWLAFVSSEAHQSLLPFFGPQLTPELSAAAHRRVGARFGYLEKVLVGNKYLLGDAFSVADAYLYTVLTWLPSVGMDLVSWPNLAAFFARVDNRPAVRAARMAEGMV